MKKKKFNPVEVNFNDLCAETKWIYENSDCTSILILFSKCRNTDEVNETGKELYNIYFKKEDDENGI